MNIEKIQAKIRAKQEMLNIETDQDKKNEILQQINVLNMRREMEETNTKIKQITDKN